MNPASLENLAPQFRPGQSGNPAGRTNPAKRKAGEACWQALLADFMENGTAAIVEMREKKPEQYVALVASGLPAEKAIDLNLNRPETMSEEQTRLMAEEIIERHKRIGLAGGREPILIAGIHHSDEAGLSAGVVASADS